MASIGLLKVSIINSIMMALDPSVAYSSAPAEGALSAEEIHSEIIGRSFQGKRMGMTATITHKQDGTSTLKLPFRTRGGTWEIEDDALCIRWGKAEKPDCVTFTRESKDMFRVEPMGLTIRGIE